MSKTTKPDRTERTVTSDGHGYPVLSSDVDGVPRTRCDGGSALDDGMVSAPVREGGKADDPVATTAASRRSREATRRLRYCLGFLCREEAGLADRSAASMKAAIRAIDGDDPKRPVPSPEADRPPPSARTLREWLRCHEGADGRPGAVAARPRGGVQRRPMARREMAPFVARYASAERPTILDCYGEFVAHARKLNENRAAAGRVPFSVPSPSTFARAVGALDPFDVIARRHGPAAASRAMGRAP